LGDFQKLLDLPTDQRRFLLRAAMLVAAFRIALWVAPFRILKRTAERSARPNKSSPTGADRISRDVRAVSRYIPAADCLPQALAALVLLRNHGFDPLLKIGVAADSARRIKAHAWVECEGRIVIGEFAAGEPFTALQ
jgi:hypothetical protein